MSNRTDWKALAEELAAQYELGADAQARIAKEFHNALVAGQEDEMLDVCVHQSRFECINCHRLLCLDCETPFPGDEIKTVARSCNLCGRDKMPEYCPGSEADLVEGRCSLDIIECPCCDRTWAPFDDGSDRYIPKHTIVNKNP